MNENGFAFVAPKAKPDKSTARIHKQRTIDDHINSISWTDSTEKSRLLRKSAGVHPQD